VNDRHVIVEGYAGQESFDLNTRLSEKTDATISQLESRIALLRRRMEGVSENLKKSNSNHAGLARYIDEGIAKALGSSVQATVVPPPSPTSPEPATPPIAPAKQQPTSAPATTTEQPSTTTTPSQPTAATTQRSEQVAQQKADSAIRLEMMSTGKDAVRAKLKDPRSATFRKVVVHKREGMILMCGEVNSKNSLGGYTGYQKFVSMGTDESTFLQEEVSDFATVWNRLCL